MAVTANRPNRVRGSKWRCSGLWLGSLNAVDFADPGAATSVNGRRLVGADDLDLLDAGGDHVIAEFQEEATAGHQVGLDGAATPGAAVDGRRGGGGCRADWSARRK